MDVASVEDFWRISLWRVDGECCTVAYCDTTQRCTEFIELICNDDTIYAQQIRLIVRALIRTNLRYLDPGYAWHFVTVLLARD